MHTGQPITARFGASGPAHESKIWSEKMIVQRKCENKKCGKVFPARSADVKRGWARFCSKSCKATAQEARTGQYAELLHRTKSFVDGSGRYAEYGETFNDAHLFSNEEHDCNKDAHPWLE